MDEEPLDEFDGLPCGMTWEEYVRVWELLNTAPPEEHHPPFPDPPDDPDEPPF